MGSSKQLRSKERKLGPWWEKRIWNLGVLSQQTRSPKGVHKTKNPNTAKVPEETAQVQCGGLEVSFTTETQNQCSRMQSELCRTATAMTALPANDDPPTKSTELQGQLRLWAQQWQGSPGLCQGEKYHLAFRKRAGKASK